MAYFVTGATGFVGRFLVQELLDTRQGTVFALCREGSLDRLERLVEEWAAYGLEAHRVVPVVGDLSRPDLGLDADWIASHSGDVEHFFHLAAIYDMTAPEALNETMNVDGTRNAVRLAGRLGVLHFHQVSSVAVSGDYAGVFDETMFDEGQTMPSAYHRTKFESEKIVREEAAVPWRIYRPAVVVGHSETGVMDKIDGPYYFFPVLKRLREAFPGWMPLVGVDLGDTNIVPVDYVAKAMDHLAHRPGLDGQVFHLVNPEPINTIGLVNTFAAAAKGPRFAVPVDRSVTGLLPTSLLPRSLRPTTLLGTALRAPAVQLALRKTIGRLGVPPEVLTHVSFPAVYASRSTDRALAGSGISVPDVDSYASTLWCYWEEMLDDSIKSDAKAVKALAGKTVVVTGASSGIGLVTAVQIAKAGGIPILVARGWDKLEETQRLIESQGGTAHAYPCDLADLDAIDALTKQLRQDFTHIDFVVNNAGRSIRRSLKLSEDRFHDFERTMQLNYFGAIRVIIGLLPSMRAQKSGHIVNISSIGVLTSPPRFSAYVASKAALDAWSNVVSSELIGDGVSFTSIHMPLVRTPMIAPTRMYDKVPTISPGQAAGKVITALVDQPHEINTKTGNLGALAHTLAPKTAFRILHLAYQVFPDSPAARGESDDGTSETINAQMVIARLLQGVHW